MASDIPLASRITWPQNSCIYYLLLKPVSNVSAVDSIEQTRCSILSSGLSTTNILQSVITSVQVTDEPFIYLFRISEKESSFTELFGSLNFNGLRVHESSFFEPPSASSLLPPSEIRQPLSHFYDALRCRIIQDIVNVASHKPSLAARRHVKRFRNGILMSQASPPSPWEYNTITRPLLFCQLQVHFSYSPEGVPSHIVIHPVLQPTPFLDLRHSLPLPPGAPITLLPFGTPAYFLTTYNGPTAGLSKQFETALFGFGAGNWFKVSGSTPSFVIAWIKVENKQGEDKGLTIIYPASFCLTCLPLSSPRAPLEYIPDLPAPLQPSPQTAPANINQVPRRPSSTPIQPHSSRPILVSSPTSESLFSFRALTLTSKDLGFVANEVGGYVDTVARERERERERLKRERENGAPSSSPKASRASATTPAAQLVDPPTPLAPTPAPTIPPSVQSFYPSPPQTTPTVTDAKTSPPMPATPLPDIAPVNTVADPPTVVSEHAAPTPITYDAFSTNSNWGQPSDNAWGMDMENMDFGVNDMTLSFDMDMSNLENSPQPPSAMFNPAQSARETNGGMEFDDAFTDDDFSFFDRPSRIPQFPDLSQEIASADTSTQLLHQTPIGSVPVLPSHFGDLAVGDHHTSPIWTATTNPFLDGLTPRSMVDHMDSAAPELAPPSRTHTPASQAAFATPDATLDIDADFPSIDNPKLFGPISFACHHTNADGKYAMGKFSLPSPSPEPEWSETTSTSLPSSPSTFLSRNGWKLRYNSATDPRLSLVKKLIGVKRKVPASVDKMPHPPFKRPLWSVRTDWDDPDVDDDSVLDANESGSEHEDDPVENESLPASRPVTPPPSYLPLGPTLIPTYFNHKDLLPLCSPLRPPGAAISALNLAHSNNPPPSFPTPVSPAAHVGAANERSRSLEAAAFAIACEVIENPVWAESWRSNVLGPNHSGEVWPADVKLMKRMLDALPSWQGVSDISSIFGLDGVSSPTLVNSGKLDQVQLLEPPMLSIGKGDAVIQILPPALRFWEKLGLSPKSGRKDVAAYVLFEDDGTKLPLVQTWLSDLTTVYEGKHYGTMTPGVSTTDAPHGMVPVRFDTSFRRTLNLLIEFLPDSQGTTIVFIVLPVALMTLSSATFRQVLALTQKAQNLDPPSVLFQFIPEQHILSVLDKPTRYDSMFDMLSASIYNKIPIPVDRVQSRSLTDFDHKGIRTLFTAPSFTLARPNHNKVTFVRSPKASLDAIDRFTLLHVGYHLTSCGKWIIACCIDQRGENHRISVWLTQSPVDHEDDAVQSDELYAVKKVWDFAMQFAKQTDIEWRVVFARLGVPSERELEAWSLYLDKEVVSFHDQPPLHHTLISVVPDAPWFFVPSKLEPTPSPRPQSARSSTAKQTSQFIDTSSTTFAIYPANLFPIPIPPTQSDLCTSHTLIAEPSSRPFSPRSPDDQGSNSQLDIPNTSASSNLLSLCQSLSILPRLTSILVNRTYDHSTKTRTASMTQIYLLQTFHSSSSGHSAPSDEELLSDLTRNFHELAVLARLRWKLDRPIGYTGLPFHLAAVDTIRTALDMDWDRLDSSAEL